MNSQSEQSLAIRGNLELERKLVEALAKEKDVNKANKIAFSLKLVRARLAMTNAL